MNETNTEINTDATPAPDAGKTPEPSQKPERTEAEKAAYSLRKNAERAKELGMDPAEVLGIKPTLNLDDDLPDDRPLTVGDLKVIQKQEARKSALQMAEDLPEDEREEVKEALGRVVPSGNAEDDLRFARAAVNAPRNAKIAEHLGIKGTPKRTAAGSSQPTEIESEFTPTAEETAMMRPPYNLSKEKVLAARKRIAEKA